MKKLTHHLRRGITRLKEHRGVGRYFKNTAWLFIGKGFSLVLSFFLFSYIARYLGPTNLGNLSYAQSFVALLSVFASFGIDGVLYRDLIKFKDQRNKLLGSAFALKAVLGVITTFVTIGIAVFSETESVIIILIGIISLSNIFQPFTIPSFYFDSVQKSKITTIGSIVINIILAIVKILIIVYDKGIIFFGATMLLEVILSGAYYTTLFSYYFDPITKWRVDLKIITSLFRQSVPLLLASISAIIYARIDQVMLKNYLDASAVGLYSVAVRIAEVWNFVPSVIIYSLFPTLINAQLSNTAMYEKRFKQLFLVMMGISAFFGLFISIFSAQLINIIAGSQYASADTTLIIYVWGVVGMVGTSAIIQLLIAEGWTRVIFYITAMGAAANILLNLWFIPLYGTSGAAISTLIAYWIVPLSPFMFTNVRHKIIAIIRNKG